MLKKSVLLIPTFTLLSFLFCFPVWAENQPKKLVPKSILSPKRDSNLPRPKTPKAQNNPTKAQPSTFESVSFSVLLGTPLIHENFFEKRFGAVGNFHLFSIPLFKLSPPCFVHFEAGPGFTLSKLTFQNPSQTFTHVFLVAPIHLRLIYSVSRDFHIEGYSGVMLRPIEYDSRNTSDGGTHSVKGSNFMTADVGLGLDYNISPPLKIRLLAGYLFLAGGIELTL